jgi:hypothetical protein
MAFTKYCMDLNFLKIYINYIYIKRIWVLVFLKMKLIH